jgi:hypothetical protein
MWDYILPIGTAFIALLQLAKDWGGHRATWRRAAVLLLIISLGIGGAVNSHYARKRSAKQHAEDQKQITGLKTAVDTANKDQRDNTKFFVEAFRGLSQKVSDLQTQVATEKLQTKLANVQAELQKTQKALAPGPKAELTFTFFPFTNPPPDTGQPVTPATSVTLPRHLDRTVHVEFTVLNLTSVDAVDVDLTLQICEACKFGKEPPGWTRLEGQPETQRLQSFPRSLARSVNPTQSVDVLVPPYIKNFTIGISYRCRTCNIPKELSKGVVHISGETLE